MRNGQPQKPLRRVRAPEVIDERRDGERHQLIRKPRGRRQRRHRPDRRRKRHTRRDSRIHRQAVADRVQVGIHAILRKINRMHGVCRRVARQGNLFGYKEEEVEAQKEVVAEDIASAESAPVALQAETIAAPLKGEVVALENVNDPVFSSGAMGKGAAIKPSGNQVVAPFDGEVQIAFPTGHAYGLKSDKGAEVLIHIGIDTVSLEGKGFDAKVQANQRIKKGDVLATFDSSVITEAGLDDTTMVIVTNTADFEDVSSVATGSVAEGADFIAVK